ncbi:DUF4124 domain-containing protein [Thiorhodococcus mannitoliphagus]|uniref:DUF4124 domain-containing protein n=1 Tax=Thiorhodococcus mannitoliphagus TaxID=329406 RepID=A0A6P1DP69_9GAMM|nr:DUF4124 domain-containing protein [Thiorhodococcus mannitoliphagus]NEX20057.1 DUF4124 domain-containing protein [Thiorhodococcus mannitoliphagus]
MPIGAGNRFICAVLLAVGGAEALAQPLYRWTHEQGLVHYSDQPPSQPHRSLHLEPATTAAKPSSREDPDTFSVLNQARVMAAERLQREQARQAAEMQRLAREHQRLELEAARAQARQAADGVAARPYFVHPLPRPPRPPLRPPPPGHRPSDPSQEPAKPTQMILKLPPRSVRLTP